MNKKKSTHWRIVMDTKTLHGDELPAEGLIVTIKKREEINLFSKADKKKTPKITLEFVELNKPMVMTNRKADQITKVLGTGEMDDWNGQKIMLVPINEKWFGAWGNVINVRPAVIVKDRLNSKHDNWDAACLAVQKGTTTIEAIEKHYELSEAVRTTLTQLIPKK